MLELLLTFGLALTCSVLATLWVRDVGLRMGIVDEPGDRRRTQNRAVPRVGGVAILLGAGLSILIPAALGFEPRWAAQPSPDGLGQLALGAVIIFGLGVADDVAQLSAGPKFLVEFLVAAGLFWSGVRLGSVSLGGDLVIALPPAIDFVLTVFWFVGMANAFNLIDGHDGVAGGIALLALATISYAAVVNGNTLVAVPSLALSGAILGFLLFNLPPASVFLGDAGSLLIGYTLAGLGLVAARTPNDGAVPVLVPAMALGLPVLDTSLAVFRRVLRGAPVFRADRGHIHHRLHDMGYPKTVVTLLMWGFGAIFSLVAVLLLTQDPLLSAVGIVLAVTLSLLAVRWMETPEVMELGRAVQRAFVQRHTIAQNVRLRDAVQLLRATETAQELAAALDHAFEKSHSDHIQLWVPADWAPVLTTDPAFVEESFGVAWRAGLEEAQELWEISVVLELATPRAGRLSLRYVRPGADALAHVDSIVRKLRPALCEALDRLLAAATTTAPGAPADRGDSEDTAADRDHGG